MQALPAQPESLCIVEMGGVEKQDELGEKGGVGFLYLNIGLQVTAPRPRRNCPLVKLAWPDPGALVLDRLSSSPSSRRTACC